MLKALELHGFKSFADKTRFVFPDGITVVVGPNGSGKSNIVDAMKWVLGEQSAKSLRGSEMSDVIFKGSGGKGRKPANTAEATIVFENKDNILAIDATEVRVSRRVYRSGEGEYLINGNPCRLRDIKDLFRGTGVGTDAYSLIEQGKVDTLLQASTKERRAIFEEAAGISRFKAKKVETQRRLDRVEQNLTRLSDIVEEVETRLRTVKNQASKARRYKDYTTRLQQLRTHIGFNDWQVFSAQLESIQAELVQLSSDHATGVGELQSSETALLEFDRDTQQLSDDLRNSEHKISTLRQQIAIHQSTTENHRKRVAEYEHEIHRHRRQFASMTSRAGDLGDQLEHVQAELKVADARHLQIETELSDRSTESESLFARLQTLRSELIDRETEFRQKTKNAADASHRLSAIDAELKRCDDTIEQCDGELSQVQGKLNESQAEHSKYAADEKELTQSFDTAKASVQEARSELIAKKKQRDDMSRQQVELQKRFAVASERCNVLEDLESRREGLSSGVREILTRAQDEAIGPFAEVKGMVADLIRVDVEYAAQIDAVLGDSTQLIVTTGSNLATSIATGQFQPEGRVGLVMLDSLNSASDSNLDQPGPNSTNLGRQPGVVGSAVQFVDADDRYQGLADHLLRDTWCVETLNDALRLSKEFPHHRFVTKQEDVVDYDGTVSAGPRQSGSGIVSRRSELRTLRVELIELQTQSEQADADLIALQEACDTCGKSVEQAANAAEALQGELTACHLRTQAAKERVENLSNRQHNLQKQRDAANDRRTACETNRISETEQQALLQQAVAALESLLTENRSSVAILERQHRECESATNATKVELAKSEQRVDDLRAQLLRFEEDKRERQNAVDDVQRSLSESQARLRESEMTMLHATSALASLHIDLETELHAIRGLLRKHASANERRSILSEQIATARKSLHKIEQRQHRQELEVNRIQLERDSVAQRVRDDYDIDLSEVDESQIAAFNSEGDDTEFTRDEINKQISDLRRKISNVGAVNMAALEEIEQMQERHDALASQYQDLVDAKNSLVRIINRINTDSRRLFTETLEAIRLNFQRMFRRVFGGGSADIVLEPDVDILEAGIDIIATPPGKHSLGISLLSGGERALTAVTLLLAIFEYGPSPFCVLDEVDGPLDEANIGRFTDVLREFLQWTKFVVVTHSKKTMTAATTLYGVTMQESGISKRVSVQFEDVSEDGHIRKEAVDRDNDNIDTEDSAGPDGERGVA